VTGAHEAVPTTVARQLPKRRASLQNFREWARVQLRKLESADLPDVQLGEALLSVHAITNDLADRYFLYDLTNKIAYFRNLELGAHDSLFIVCSRHPFYSKIEVSSYQGIVLFAPPECRAKSDQFKYVLQLHSSVQEKL
jgi:hypothetical protein